MSDKKMCGNCKWKAVEYDYIDPMKKIGKDPWRFKGKAKWYCSNPESDCCGAYTAYDDSCMDWEE